MALSSRRGAHIIFGSQMRDGWRAEVGATCIATAIGAVVCEYEHLPPWTYNILDRIRRATSEVTELTKNNSKS